MSREFVDSVVSGNNIEAETKFKNSISTKVGDALEIKRKEYFNNTIVTPFRQHNLNDFFLLLQC